MMTALTLFQTLRSCGVELTPHPDGTLGYKAPKGILTPQLLDAMRAHKPMLLDLVETFSERAAMLEFDAGLDRADAEWLAWQELGGEGPPRALAS
jgi:hypothetical protein